MRAIASWFPFHKFCRTQSSLSTRCNYHQLMVKRKKLFINKNKLSWKVILNYNIQKLFWHVEPSTERKSDGRTQGVNFWRNCGAVSVSFFFFFFFVWLYQPSWWCKFAKEEFLKLTFPTYVLRQSKKKNLRVWEVHTLKDGAALLEGTQ